MLKKKIIINIEKSYIELDWIMPVLEKLKDNYEIITLFKNIKEIENLKKNKFLFHTLEKISSKYFTYNLFDKVLIFFFGIIDKLNLKFKFFNFIFHPKNIFFSKGIGYEQIKYFFTDFNSYSPILRLIGTNKQVGPKIIRYPNSVYIFSKPKKDAKISYALIGDLLLLNYIADLEYWKLRIDEKKIKVVGTPKFEKYWIDKSKKYFNNFKSNKYILLAYSSRFNQGYDDILLRKQLIDIMDTLIEFKDYKIIIKIHPRKNNKEYLNILKNYDKTRWEITEEHISSLLENASLYLHDRNSSTLIEGLALNKRCIEYWDPVKEINSIEIFINDELNLNIKAHDKKDLKRYIHMGLEDKDNYIWQNQFKN